MAESAKRVAKKFRLEGGVQPDKPPHERPIEDMQNLRSPLGGGSGLHPREGICPVITLTTSKATGAAIHLVEVPGKSQSKLLTITSAAGGEIREIVETPNSFGRYLDPGETSYTTSGIITDPSYAIPVYIGRRKNNDNPARPVVVLCLLWYPVNNVWHCHYLNALVASYIGIRTCDENYWPPIMLSSDLFTFGVYDGSHLTFPIFSVAKMKSDGAAYSKGAVTYADAIKTDPEYRVGADTAASATNFRINEYFAVDNPNQDGIWNIPVDLDTTSGSCLRWIELSTDGASLKSGKISIGDRRLPAYSSKSDAPTEVSGVSSATSGPFSSVFGVTKSSYNRATVVPCDPTDTGGYYYYAGVAVIDNFYTSNPSVPCVAAYYELPYPMLVASPTGNVTCVGCDNGTLMISRGNMLVNVPILEREKDTRTDTTGSDFQFYGSSWTQTTTGARIWYKIYQYASGYKSVTLGATYTNVSIVPALGGYGATTWFTHDTSSNGTFKLAYIDWSAASPAATNLCTLTTSGTLGDWFRLDSRYAVCLIKKPESGYGTKEYAWVKVDLVGASTSILTVAEAYSADTIDSACPKVSGGVGWDASYSNPRMPFNPSRFLEEYGWLG